MALVKTWPRSRVLLACFAWVLAVSSLLVWEFVRETGSALSASAGTGVGAVSVSIGALVARVALVVVPPIVLYTVWAAGRPK